MGLCGNALKNVVVREDVPLVTIEDDGLVDDCIVALLGRERYMEELRRTGSFFLSNGWVTHWDRIVRKVERDMESFNMVLRLDDYRRTRFIHTPEVDDGDVVAEAQRLSRIVEKSAGRDRGLAVTLSALEKSALCLVHCLAVAFWAFKSVWPANGDEIINARLFTCKAFSKFRTGVNQRCCRVSSCD